MDDNKNFIDLSDREKIKVAQAAAQFGAFTTLEFHSTNVGYRAVNTDAQMVMGIGMVVATCVFPAAFNPHPWLMPVYAASMVVIGKLCQWRRWQDFCRGVTWDSYSCGISVFQKFRWPSILTSFNRVQRFIDPAAVALAGVLIFPFCKGLGCWLGFAGFCEYVVHGQVFKNAVGQLMDHGDAKARAEAAQIVMQHFGNSASSGALRPLTVADTRGSVATGLTADLQARIAQPISSMAAPTNITPQRVTRS